jgi:hypothetical protein
VSSVFAVTSVSYVATLGTLEGYIVLDSVPSPYNFIKVHMAVDIPNRRMTLMGTFTSTNAGKLSRVYFKILSPEGDVMAELEIANLADMYNLYVQPNVTYKIIVGFTW